MKKTLVTILATVLMSLGLVAAVEAPAQSACPYSACIPTTTKAKHPASISGTSITVKVRVKPQAGSGTPVGKVRVGIKKYNGAYLTRKTFDYNGGKVAFEFAGLTKKGKYRVVAKFIPGSTSVYRGSKSRTTFIKK